MTNLATFPWTDGDDIAFSLLTPAYLGADQAANAGNGNDAVIGIGLIPGGGVNADLFVAGAYVGPSGVYLAEGAVLDMGNGADLVFGTGANGVDAPSVFLDGFNGGDGIRNRGTIRAGNGSDATVGLNFNLDLNLGPINFPIVRGQGGDGFDATSSTFNDGSDGGNGGAGIRNFGTGKILTGNGRDVIFGTGGRGGDGGNATPGAGSGLTQERDGGDGGRGGDGIRNLSSGQIVTANGDDLITGIGGLGGVGGARGNDYQGGTVTFLGQPLILGPSNDGADGANGFGIYNDGIIDMGNGDDVLDACIGGFGGSGTVKMGRGHDVVKGFGSGKFEGGLGADRLVFGAGSYDVSVGVGGFFNIASGGVTMQVKEFEFINTQAFGTGNFTFA